MISTVRSFAASPPLRGTLEPAGVSQPGSQGVDAAGDSIGLIGGDSWSVDLHLPGSDAGSFGSDDNAGAVITFTDENGKEYTVGDKTPTVLIRPRGWRLC